MILYLKSWANYQIYNNLLFVVCSNLFLHECVACQLNEAHINSFLNSLNDYAFIHLNVLSLVGMVVSILLGSHRWYLFKRFYRTIFD